MFKAAQVPSTVDPANDTHYAISEQDELRLRLVASAAEMIGQLMEQLDPERADYDDAGIGAIFHTLSFAIEGALAGRAVVIPRARSK